MRWTAPGRMTSPARSDAPNVASLFASQATHRAGLPSTAAPAPVSTSSPCRVTIPPTTRRSMSVTLRRLPPTTSRPDDALSATVSTSLICQSATRLSTISTAGRGPGMAVRRGGGGTPGPAVANRPRGQRAGEGGQGAGRGDAGTGQVLLHDKGQLRLDPRLQQATKIHFVAVFHEHVVEQNPVVRLADAEQLLHGKRGQADLAATDP